MLRSIQCFRRNGGPASRLESRDYFTVPITLPGGGPAFGQNRPMCERSNVQHDPHAHLRPQPSCFHTSTSQLAVREKVPAHIHPARQVQVPAKLGGRYRGGDKRGRTEGMTKDGGGGEISTKEARKPSAGAGLFISTERRLRRRC
jgi:hypothetical protein